MLKEYFERNRIDPVQFAVENGISITSIYRYLRGARPTYKIACKIEKLTDGQVKLEDLRGKSETKSPR